MGIAPWGPFRVETSFGLCLIKTDSLEIYSVGKERSTLFWFKQFLPT